MKIGSFIFVALFFLMAANLWWSYQQSNFQSNSPLIPIKQIESITTIYFKGGVFYSLIFISSVLLHIKKYYLANNVFGAVILVFNYFIGLTWFV